MDILYVLGDVVDFGAVFVSHYCSFRCTRIGPQHDSILLQLQVKCSKLHNQSRFRSSNYSLSPTCLEDNSSDCGACFYWRGELQAILCQHLIPIKRIENFESKTSAHLLIPNLLQKSKENPPLGMSTDTAPAMPSSLVFYLQFHSSFLHDAVL